MRITCGLVGAWVVALLFIGSGIAQESFVPELEPFPAPGIAGAVPPILENGAVSQLLPDGISPKKAEAVLSRIPATERRTRGVHDVALFRLLSPSVVLVVTNEGIGSGSVISGGLILTNWHVVEGYKQVGVVFKPSSPGAKPSRADVIAADVIKVDQVRDLALLRPLTFPTIAPKPIELADEKDIAIGQTSTRSVIPREKPGLTRRASLARFATVTLGRPKPKLSTMQMSFKRKRLSTQETRADHSCLTTEN
jgi:S1-C subfamily serine protease